MKPGRFPPFACPPLMAVLEAVPPGEPEGLTPDVTSRPVMNHVSLSGALAGGPSGEGFA